MTEKIAYPVKAGEVDRLIKHSDISRGRLRIRARPELVETLDNLTGKGTGMYKGVELVTDVTLSSQEIEFEEGDT